MADFTPFLIALAVVGLLCAALCAGGTALLVFGLRRKRKILWISGAVMIGIAVVGSLGVTAAMFG
jgi:uncharacterized membrane protein